MYKIDHDPNFNIDAGYVFLNEKPFDGKDPLKRNIAPEHKKTLLYLLFWATYTHEGRQFCRINQSGLHPRKREGIIYKHAGAESGDAKAFWDEAKSESEQDIFYDDERIRKNLGEKFKTMVDGDLLIESLIEAKIAAGHWTNLEYNFDPATFPNKSKEALLDEQAAKYKHHMSHIMWNLWENFQAHEFSMDW